MKDRVLKFELRSNNGVTVVFGAEPEFKYGIMVSGADFKEAIEELRKHLSMRFNPNTNGEPGFIEVKQWLTWVGSYEAFIKDGTFDLKTPVLVGFPDLEPTEKQTEPIEERPTFESELVGLLNLYAIDSECNTPNYVLARFIKDMLQTYAKSVTLRDKDETVQMLRNRENGN